MRVQIPPPPVIFAMQLPVVCHRYCITRCPGQKGRSTAAALIIAAIVIILAIWFITLRNGIVEKNSPCNNALQTIDTQLQIPNLVETVKGYAKHESETLETVVAARVTNDEHHDDQRAPCC